MFENVVLRRTFRAGRDKVKGEWRRLQNQDLYDLYRSPNVIRVIKSRKMRWTGHVARVGGGQVRTGGDLSEREHSQDPGLDGRLILK
jgi:hypothetical protein